MKVTQQHLTAWVLSALMFVGAVSLFYWVSSDRPVVSHETSSIYPLDAATIYASLMGVADPAVHCKSDSPLDRYYFLPTIQNIDDMMLDVHEHMHLEYIYEAWDCDDHAKEFSVLANRWFIDHVTKGAPLATPIVIALAHISDGFAGMSLSPSGALHAVNLILDDHGDWWVIDAKRNMKAHLEAVLAIHQMTVMKILW